MSIDPVTFMSTGDPRMFNRYAYSYNDPINMLDLDGRKPEHIMDRHVQGAANAWRQHPQQTAAIWGTAAAATYSTVLPGPEDVAIGAFVATKAGQAVANVAGKIGGAIKGAVSGRKATVDVGSPPISVGNTPNAARVDLDAAGYPGSPTTQTNEVGTLHEGVPGVDGAMDVRVMNGQAGSASGTTTGPRMVTTRAGSGNDGVKVDGSIFRNNESKAQRNAGCHTSLECN